MTRGPRLHDQRQPNLLVQLHRRRVQAPNPRIDPLRVREEAPMRVPRPCAASRSPFPAPNELGQFRTGWMGDH
eukprot:2968711-Rhodomonas_salina.5